MIKLIKINDIEIKPIEACDKGLCKEIKSVKVKAYALSDSGDYISIKKIAQRGGVASIEIFYFGGGKVLFDGYVYSPSNEDGFDLVACGFNDGNHKKRRFDAL